MSDDELTETYCFGFHPYEGEEQWRLKQARLDAQPISNHAFALKRLGWSDDRVIDEMPDRLSEVDYVKNNAQAVARKACEAYDAYQRALSAYHDADDPSFAKPQPPSTDRRGAYPLVMNHGEGYALTVEDGDELFARVSPQPYHPVRGRLRGRTHALDRVQEALSDESDERVGRAELLYRDDVYYLHVTVSKPASLTDPETAESIISVDINERNIAVSVFDRESMDTLATIVMDYGRVKHERKRLYDIRRRCNEHAKYSVVNRIGSQLERFTEWTLHRLSRVVEYYVEWFPNPVVVFERLTGIRQDMAYGSYMNRRLHQLPFHAFERQVTYKAHRHGAPIQHVRSPYNSQRCGCCGEKGSRRGGRFSCSNESCSLEQDHSDRNATVNAAARCVALLETGDDSHAQADNYRPRKTPPQVRVRRVGSGRSSGDVNRPTASQAIAEQGVLR